jgi:hypothetical protein
MLILSLLKEFRGFFGFASLKRKLLTSMLEARFLRRSPSFITLFTIKALFIQNYLEHFGQLFLGHFYIKNLSGYLTYSCVYFIQYVLFRTQVTHGNNQASLIYIHNDDFEILNFEFLGLVAPWTL